MSEATGRPRMPSRSTIAMTGGDRAARGAREKNDFYRTPPRATRALLDVEAFPREVWEPACGDGAISAVLAEAGHVVTSTDLVPRGFGEPFQDFLLEQEARASCIITNPPFKLADEFVLHALSLGIRHIAILQRLAWLEGGARHTRLWRAHPPARVWVFRKRLTMWRGDDPNARENGGAIPFAWFVWTPHHTGAPQLGWVA
jgi:hypothetical protein